MRTIKFRAFVKKENRIFPCSGPWMGNAMVILESGDKLVFQAYPEEKLEIMQFTGLKDKNGKDIWEGDIVTLNRILIPSGKPAMAQILYKSPTFLWLSDLEAGIDFTQVQEVIGNIYENPDLLKTHVPVSEG